MKSHEPGVTPYPCSLRMRESLTWPFGCPPLIETCLLGVFFLLPVLSLGLFLTLKYQSDATISVKNSSHTHQNSPSSALQHLPSLCTPG